MSTDRRHYSGVLVSTDPARLVTALEALSAVKGARVHQVDAPTARCVVVLESADRAGQERLFRTLEALPGVQGVDLTHHWIDSEPEAPEEEIS